MKSDQELIDALFSELEDKDKQIKSLRQIILEMMQTYVVKQCDVHEE